MSFGISLTIKVSYLGVSAWDVLSLGLSSKFGLSVGTWTLIISLILVAIVFFINPTYISFGTIGNTLAIGPMVDLFLHLENFQVQESIVFDASLFFFGTVLAGIGGGLYVSGKFGAGPRDSILLILCERIKWDIAKVRISMELTVFTVGALLGGPVFIGTIASTIIISLVFKKTISLYNEFTNKRSANIHIKAMS